MSTQPAAPKTIDEYIAMFPGDVRAILEQIRATIKTVAPGAEETISYQMPTFRLHGTYLIYFAAYKKYIGLYPASTGIAEFEQEIAQYGAGKGTMKFPLGQPIPFELIARIVEFRVKQSVEVEHGS